MKNLAAWAAWGGNTLHFLSFLVPPFLSLPSFHPSFLTPSRLPSLPLPFPSTPSANVVLCSFRRSITLPFTAFCIIFSDSAPPPPPPPPNLISWPRPAGQAPTWRCLIGPPARAAARRGWSGCTARRPCSRCLVRFSRLRGTKNKY